MRQTGRTVVLVDAEMRQRVDAAYGSLRFAFAHSEKLQWNNLCHRDEIIIMTFATMDPAEARIHKPMVLIVDRHNNPKSRHLVGEQGEQLS